MYGYISYCYYLIILLLLSLALFVALLSLQDSLQIENKYSTLLVGYYFC